MAALIPKTVLQVAKRQTICATSIGVQACQYSSDPRIIKNPTTASLKRGTGGRSSFSGLVCTVFGANGFVGQYVCNRLGKIGSQVIIPYRSDYNDVLPMKLYGDLGQILFHPFDVRDDESIRRCIKYSNVVVNLMSKDWETLNFTFEDINVNVPRKLARMCREAGCVQKFIHVSCLNANPNPTPHLMKEGSRFLKTKWEGEQAVFEEFPNATIIRPASIFGHEDRFLAHYSNRWRFMINRRLPLWEKGLKTEKQPLWVGDVAAGIVAVIHERNCHGKIYEFVGPHRYNFADLIDWLLKHFHVNAEYAGYKRVNIKYHPLYKLKITFTEMAGKMFLNPYGYLTWEKLEQECISDVVHEDMPKLEDLGIIPVSMQSRLHWEVVDFRLDYDVPEIDYYESIPPPPTVATKYKC